MARYKEYNCCLVSGAYGGQAFIYKVPEGFSLRTEEGETVKDVAPVQRLSGHSRWAVTGGTRVQY